MRATDRPNKIKKVIAIVNMLFPNDSLLGSSAYEFIEPYSCPLVGSFYFSYLLI
jgi:hypothetical protein